MGPLERQHQPSPQPKTKKALPNDLNLDQCDSIKALVKARAEVLPEEKRGAATIKLWSSVKSNFGCSYKEIAPEHFTEALSLVARLELEGEYLAAEPQAPQLTPPDLEKPIADKLRIARFLAITDNEGRLILKEVPNDRFVFTAKDIAKLINDPNAVEQKLVPDILTACTNCFSIN